MDQAVATHEPKAVACYGLPVRRWEDAAADDDPAEALWVRFVDGRPISGLTTQYLAWCCAKPAAAGKTASLLVWDDASWHISREVTRWIAAHNHDVHAGQATGRVVACPLPSKSPRLNPIEPKWVHGKRRVVEPARLLTMDELEARVYDALGADHADRLATPARAA